MPLAKLVLGLLLLLLLFFDYATMPRRNWRALALESFVFVLGGLVILAPETTTFVATKLGISRGVDLVLYVVTIVLVREAILNRSARIAHEERMTEIVRTVAIATARSHSNDS